VNFSTDYWVSPQHLATARHRQHPAASPHQQAASRISQQAPTTSSSKDVPLREKQQKQKHTLHF
jgi:hypothetical protein